MAPKYVPVNRQSHGLDSIRCSFDGIEYSDLLNLIFIQLNLIWFLIKQSDNITINLLLLLEVPASHFGERRNGSH
jgi:hypothetical protein